MNTKIQHIIYDWDGTLCDSIPRAFQATCKVFTRCNLPPPTFADYAANLGPPFIDFYRERGVPDSVSDEQVWKWYIPDANHHESELFPDVISALSAQRKNGCTLALVTSQLRSTVESLLKKHRCAHLFDFALYDSPDKAVCFRQACHLMKADPGETYCVGDFGTDIVKAKAAGVIPIGIMRNGQNIAEALYSKGATRVITGLRDLIIKF